MKEEQTCGVFLRIFTKTYFDLCYVLHRKIKVFVLWSSKEKIEHFPLKNALDKDDVKISSDVGEATIKEASSRRAMRARKKLQHNRSKIQSGYEKK